MRPTGDRAREAWMSILQPRIPGARVVDLFAGSGALGLEALSRGAASADFVEQSATGLRAIQENGDALGATSRMRVHRADAMRFVKKLSPYAYDIAFADPPYRQGFAQALAQCWLREPFARVLSVEHDAHEELPPGGDRRTYGGTAITIYDVKAMPAAEPND